MGTAARIPDTQQTLEKTSLYRRDYYTWARQQVAALKRRDFDAIDRGRTLLRRCKPWLQAKKAV